MDILLISHGPFCNGIKKSLEMISGNMENVTSEEFKPGQNPSDISKKSRRSLQSRKRINSYV